MLWLPRLAPTSGNVQASGIPLQQKCDSCEQTSHVTAFTRITSSKCCAWTILTVGVQTAPGQAAAPAGPLGCCCAGCASAQLCACAKTAARRPPVLRAGACTLAALDFDNEALNGYGCSKCGLGRCSAGPRPSSNSSLELSRQCLAAHTQVTPFVLTVLCPAPNSEHVNAEGNGGSL